MANTKKSCKKRQQKSLNILPKIQIAASLILILVGAGLLILPAVKKVASTTIPPQAAATRSHESLAKPAKIYIPKLERLLYVSDGYVKNNRWTISETGVSYYTDSALPGLGNTVLYGHNTRDKLGGLWRVGNRDYVYVVLTDGNFVKYEVSETKEIKPTQVEILDQTPNTQLTLYTCSGFLDSARFVVIANQVAI